MNPNPDSMNIYSAPGAKVVLSRPTQGYNHDRERVRKHLVAGATYTVARCEVSPHSTWVYLQEQPNIGFNSVQFTNL